MKNFVLISWIFGLLNCCYGYPIDPGAMVASSTVGLATLGLVFLVLSILFLIGCACCRNNQGFKQFRDSTTSLNQIGFTNRLAAEVSIFPPPGITAVETRSPPRLGGQPPPSLNTKPAAFSLVAPDISDWLGDPTGNYPRQNLFYQRELGKGWFGKVVEGEAKGVKVVVRILREDATDQEKAHFLHEAKPFRDLRHRNVVSLYGKCVDQDPFLLLFNLCNNGDLKSFLVTNAGSKAVLNEQGICLRMMTDIAEGLNYMIENNFIHTDLAARNCLVSSDLTVKIGDYGTGIDLYRDEYYITENVAIPIRWCAPETLHCTPTTIEAKQVTSSANVWSLAVVLWEIAEFGRLPYDSLTDDQVIIRVFGSEQLRLPQPDAPYGPFLYNILQLCWKLNDRASLSQILSMLHYMRTNPHQENEFEARWRSMKPNSVTRVDNHVPVHSQSADIQAVQLEQKKTPHSDNHTPLHSPRHTELALRPQLTARSEFDSGVDLEMKATESSATPTTLSPQLSVTSDEFLQSKKSASLTNLQGSLEEVHHLDSWLEGVEQNTEEDRTFVKNVSQAIKSLDKTLADEEEDASKPLMPAFRLGPLKSESSSSDTEEETWRTRIERGEFTEKVKEKSKSVTDLMVLTHIESEGSESDSLPSLTRQHSTRKSSLGKPAFTSIGFGSEGNIRSAVLSEELQHKLKQLSLWKSSGNNEESQAFLAKVASETTNSKHVYKTPPFLKNIKVKPLNSAKKTSPVATKDSPEKLVTPCEPYSLPVYLDNKDIDVNSERLCDSSQKYVDSKIPEITVTETNMPDSYVEPESDVDTDHMVQADVKQRKAVFVFRERDFGDEDDSSETASQNDGELAVSDLVYDNIPLKEESSESPSDTQNTSVILGSCEHYTLDYFKGLKTMFVPPDSSSDDGSYRFESNEDFVNDDSHSQANEDDMKCCDSQNMDDDKVKCPKHRDSMDDLLPDSLTASVTTISTSSGYATFDKDKMMKQDYSYLSDDHSFSPSRDSLLGKSDSLSWDKLTCDKQSTELFLSSEKSMNSLNLIEDEKNYHDDLDDSPRKFIVGDVVSQNVMVDSYCNPFSSDLDRVSHQEHEIKELKTRLEDAMKMNNDYHLVKGSEEEGYGKIATPDDERSSDSGFRDKGSLSESAEDTCDEKYNIEDIDAELEEYGKCEGYDSGRDDWNSWLPQSIDYDSRESVSVDVDFLNALRNELKDKLPQATQCHPDDESTSGSKSPESSPEPESIEGAVQFSFPCRLSPILEERESNQSSLIIDDLSPYRLFDDSRLDDEDPANRTYSVDDDIGNRTYTVDDDMCNRTYTVDDDSNNRTYTIDDSSVNRTYTIDDSSNRKYLVSTPEDRDSLTIEDLEDGAQFTLHSGSYPVEEDVLVVDVETNEATLIESPKPHSHLAFSSFSQPIERFNEEYQTSNEPLAYLPPRDSANLSPDMSVSSPEQDNLSGFFLSPCSVRSDLFDSGPPSLPFDFGQSLDEVDDISPTHSCDVRKSASCNTLTGEDYGFKNSSDVSPALTLSASPKLQSEDLSPVTVKENIDIVEALQLDLPSEYSNGDTAALNDPLVDSSELVANLESLSYDPIEKLVQQSALNSEVVVAETSPCKVSEGLTENQILESTSSKVPIEMTDKNVDSFNEANREVLAENIFGIVDPQRKGDTGISDNLPVEKFSEDLVKEEMLIDVSDSLNVKNYDPAVGNEITLLPDLVTSVEAKNTQDTSVPVDHKKAENQIDLLITKECPNDNVNEDDARDNKNSIDAEAQNEKIEKKADWLAKLLSNSDTSGVDPSGWPSPEELVVTSLSSTLALTSPSGEYPNLPLTPCSPVNGCQFPSSPTPPLQASSLASPDDSTSWRPTISQLLDMTSDGDAAEEMTTSFIEPDENGTYTPDWESDTSESSSSGEFIWKSQEPKMERIDEEDEDDTSCSGSEGSCTSEFVPSTWDSSLIPCKPALRQTPSDFSPTKIPSSNEKRKVVFKKEKYRCVYEYPREPASDDEEDSSVWNTTSTLFDYFDWELGDSECWGPAEQDSEEDSTKEKKQDCDFYRLNDISSSFDEGDILIPGSGQSQFFPGAFNSRESLDDSAASDLSPTEPSIDTKEASTEVKEDFPKIAPKEPVDESKDSLLVEREPLIIRREYLTSAELGVLRHTKDSLKLDLKPCQPDRGEANILDSGIDTC